MPDKTQPTELHKIKAKHPNLSYESGCFYPTEDQNDPHWDEFICIPGTSTDIDADEIIRDYYRWFEQDQTIDTNWIKDHFGDFDKAFKNCDI